MRLKSLECIRTSDVPFPCLAFVLNRWWKKKGKKWIFFLPGFELWNALFQHFKKGLDPTSKFTLWFFICKRLAISLHSSGCRSASAEQDSRLRSVGPASCPSSVGKLGRAEANPLYFQVNGEPFNEKVQKTGVFGGIAAPGDSESQGCFWHARLESSRRTAVFGGFFWRDLARLASISSRSMPAVLASHYFAIFNCSYLLWI